MRKLLLLITLAFTTSPVSADLNTNVPGAVAFCETTANVAALAYPGVRVYNTDPDRGAVMLNHLHSAAWQDTWGQMSHNVGIGYAFEAFDQHHPNQHTVFGYAYSECLTEYGPQLTLLTNQ